MIRVKYYGILKKNMPETAEDGYWHCERDGRTIAELFEETGVSAVNVGMTVLVNRMREERGYVLRDGDILTVMPLVAGG